MRTSSRPESGALVGVAAAAVTAGPGGQLRIERGWYNGDEVRFLQPSLFSAKPNGGVLACFGLGPDLSGVDRPTQPLYVIFDDTATEDHCDGNRTCSDTTTCSRSAPGDPGYSAAWRLVLLVEATPASIEAYLFHESRALVGCVGLSDPDRRCETRP